MKMYKVMNKTEEGIFSPYQDMEYELGKWYTCDNFDDDIKNDCSYGFYATGIEGLIYAIGNAVYECEVRGKEVKYDIYKHRHEEIKLNRELEKEEIRGLAKKCECGYNLEEVLYPVNPLHIKRSSDVTEEELKWIKQGDSVRDSVGAYTSSLFPNIKKWEYIDHDEGENPFQPCINLWQAGLVPSYDGKVWRLHAGENADVIWEEK